MQRLETAFDFFKGYGQIAAQCGICRVTIEMFQGCCRRATADDCTATKMPPPRLRRAFFDRSVHEVAPELIGATLLIDGIGGRIVEVEAYHHTDPAAHSYGGPTERNRIMFGPPGYAYVYRSYGIHWCLNFVCEIEGSASAVLIRAVEPLEGLATMRRRRGVSDERQLCSGPGKVGEALAVTRDRLNGLALDRAPFALFAREEKPEIATGIRIGITKAADLPWRYGLKGSKFLSKPFSDAPRRRIKTVGK
jgi:DNA-3-methyladenine glycosylase